jgi:ABC-2 type transport system permease protein
MNWYRIRAILLHSWYHASHSMETWIDLLWFTIFEALVFGFMTLFFAQNDASFAQALMLGLVLWEVVRIGQYSITVSVMWEIWSKSFSSMFISPLTLKEMMTGQMLSGLIKTLLVTVLVSLISYFFFDFSVLQLGIWFGVYFLILLGFAYAAGIFITGLIFRYGTDIQSLAWGLIFMLQPISAVFYPLSILPVQIQWLAKLSPITFVMEAARAQLQGQGIDFSQLAIALGLTVIYFIGASLFLNKMYQSSRKTGSFARLGN